MTIDNYATQRRQESLLAEAPESTADTFEHRVMQYIEQRKPLMKRLVGETVLLSALVGSRYLN